MANKYTKVIQIKPVLEKLSTKDSLQSIVNGYFSNFQEKSDSTVESIKKKLKGLKEQFKDLEEAKKASDIKLKDSFNLSSEDLKKEEKNNKKLQKQLEEANKLINQTNQELKFEKGAALGAKGKAITDKIESMGQNSIKFIKNIGTSAINFVEGLAENAINEIQNMASYSLSTTLKINQEARDLALQYGLTDAQTYAYSKVKEEMGITSEEDVWLMTPTQRERFAERIGYYSGEYDKLANKGFFESYEKFQAEMIDFKQEMIMKVVEFFTQNGDAIKYSLEVGVSILEGLMKVVSWIANKSGFNGNDVLSDAINNYSTSSKNTNISIDNTFNGVSATDQMKLRKIGNDLNRTLISQLDN